MKVIKKMMAAMCALVVAASAFAAVSVSAANNADNPLDIYLTEVTHTAKGLYTINVDYKDYVVNTGVASLSLTFEVSDDAAISKVSGSPVNCTAGALTNYWTADGKGYIGTTVDSVTGDVVPDFSKTEGTYYTYKIKLNDGYYDATTGDVTKPITIKLSKVVGSFGDKVYDEDFDEWSFDSTKVTPVSLNNGVNSSKDLALKPATPEEPKPDYVYDEKNPSATNWKAADTDVAPSVYEGTDGSKAVGAKATVNPGSDKNTYTGLVWKVKSADGAKTYTYTQGVNITGAADFVYGIVINGATESDVDLNSFGVAVK